MLNLKDLKVVFFDFDDTLCIHTHHKDWNYTFTKNTTPEIYDKHECKKNYQMKKFIELLAELGIEMHMISATSEICRPVKLKWIEKNYGVTMIDSCTLQHSEKVAKMIEYCDNHNIKYSQALFIDDIFSNVQEAYSCGLQACNPMEVVNFINERKMDIDSKDI